MRLLDLLDFGAQSDFAQWAQERRMVEWRKLPTLRSAWTLPPPSGHSPNATAFRMAFRSKCRATFSSRDPISPAAAGPQSRTSRYAGAGQMQSHGPLETPRPGAECIPREEKDWS